MIDILILSGLSVVMKMFGLTFEVDVTDVDDFQF
jgi:hypothetical protein